MHPVAKFALFVVLAAVSLIAAILACFMITDKSSNKMEYYWWVFLMCTTWIAFGGSALAAGVSGYVTFRRTAMQPAGTVMNTPVMQVPMAPIQAPTVVPTIPENPLT